MTYKGMVLAGCAVLALAGCKKDLSEITDDQIVALVSRDAGGFGTMFGAPAEESDRPKRISKAALECVDYLSGSNAEIVQDMPKEMLGIMKTECRQMFHANLNDPAINTAKLEMEDFERPEFAALVHEVAGRQEAKLQEHLRKERAVKLEELKAELDQVSGKVTELVGRVDAYRVKIAELCADYRPLKQEIDDRGVTFDRILFQVTDLCQTDGEVALSTAANALAGTQAQIANFEMPDLDNWPRFFPPAPRVPNVQFDWFEGYVTEIQETNNYLKERLAVQ